MILIKPGEEGVFVDHLRELAVNLHMKWETSNSEERTDLYEEMELLISALRNFAAFTINDEDDKRLVDVANHMEQSLRDEIYN